MLLTRFGVIRNKITKQSFQYFSNCSVQQLETQGLYHLTLSNLAGKNAFSKSFIQEFRDKLIYIKNIPDVRCLVIKSEVPKVFCAGADLKERMNMAENEVGPFVDSLRDTMMMVSELPFPTIAAIEGVALGGGLELALACDIRIASREAILGLSETSLAIIPGAGGTQRITRLLGPSKAKELIFTASRMNGEQALEIGLVNHCVEPGMTVSKANEISVNIAKKGPVAIRMAKEAIDQGIQVDIKHGMEIERKCYYQLIPTSDRVEGLKAFVEKRQPEYKGK